MLPTNCHVTKLQVLTFLRHNDEALRNARLHKNPYQFLYALLAIYDAQREQNRADPRLLEEMLEVANTFPRATLVDDYATSDLLSDLALALMEIGHTDEAVHLARSLHSEVKVPTLIILADHMALKSRDQAIELAIEALTTARAEMDESTVSLDFSDYLADVAVILAKIGRDSMQFITEALSLARNNPSFRRQAEALAVIASAMSEIGYDDARNLFDEALAAARSEPCDYCRWGALWTVGDTMAKAGYLESALQLASQGEPAIVDWAVRRLASMGRLAEAQNVITQLGVSQQENLPKFSDEYIEFLIENERFTDAVALARQAEPKRSIHILRVIALSMAKAGMAEALKMIEEIESHAH